MDTKTQCSGKRSQFIDAGKVFSAIFSLDFRPLLLAVSTLQASAAHQKMDAGVKKKLVHPRRHKIRLDCSFYLECSNLVSSFVSQCLIFDALS